LPSRFSVFWQGRAADPRSAASKSVEHRETAMSFPFAGLLVAFGSLPLQAEMIPADYREEISRRAAAVVDDLLNRGETAMAVRWGSRFEKQVLESGVVEYEVGLASNALGKHPSAIRHYRRAIELDPNLAAAWYDLGELLLANDELDEAARSFTRASELRPDHWAGPFRLSEVAARRKDADSFEKNFREALRRGFDVRTVVHDSYWRSYEKDPTIGPVLRRLVTVYVDGALIEEFEKGP
jgi:tetratricopeptide (TPR) repeat protein